jgi:dTDP-4-amino-4,6-dideoxygalactose transaminase
VTCFSLQQSKHITTGEGGIVITDDPEIYKRAVLYSNCGMPWYQYGLEPPRAQPVGDLRTRGHFAFGHNYRMSELQGAVALAQLGKIAQFNEQRRKLVEIIESELRGVEGIELPYIYPGTKPNYWAYGVRVPAPLGTYSEINYLEVVYQQMQRNRRTSVGYPLPDYVQYKPGICPKAEEGARRMRSIGTHHGADPEGIRKAAQGIRDAVQNAMKG